MVRRIAHLDHSLGAAIVSRRPMRYRAGPDTSLDRPAHLRAGSGAAWIGDRIAVVQDDANFLALVDPKTGLADAITLPAGEDGLRQFDDSRGNKKFKLDLEACCVVAGADGPQLIAFGSGTKKRRRRAVTVDRWHDAQPRVSVIDATAFYLALEDEVDFSGSDMNIEGALMLADTVRLFGRGNGTPAGGNVPLNATCDVRLHDLLAYLASSGQRPAPSPVSVAQFELGAVDGLALGFTDATLHGRAVLYGAAAEASSTASDDGEVSGSVIGVMPAAGDLRYARVTDAHGEPTRDKIEGLVSAARYVDGVYAVIDADDATRPSELCEVRLTGAWE
jgi:hypothetical protein